MKLNKLSFESLFDKIWKELGRVSFLFCFIVTVKKNLRLIEEFLHEPRNLQFVNYIVLWYQSKKNYQSNEVNQ